MGGLERRYDDALARVTSALLRRVEEPRLTLDVRRDGAMLAVEPVPALASLVPTQEIATRRVHGNVALFVALTLAVPAVSWRRRVLWLGAGGLLLAATHVAHVTSYAHHHYALHNVGPYYTPIAEDRLWDLGWRELWDRPAARARVERLVTADLFNVVGQRVFPILIWLPLLTGARFHIRPVVRRRPLVAGAAVMAVALVTAACWRVGVRPAADVVETVRLGTSAVGAKLALDARGYEWTVRQATPYEALIDAWPSHAPLADERYGPRFNWIGLRIEQPPEVVPTMDSACVTAIATSPSDTRRERIRLAAEPAAVCAGDRSGPTASTGAHDVP